MAIAAVGSVLPWIRVSEFGLTVSQSGWEKDGSITIFLALIGLAFFVVAVVIGRKWPFIVSLVFSAIVIIILIIDIYDIVKEPFLEFSHVGYGMYVALVGAVLGIIAGVAGLATRRT